MVDKLEMVGFNCIIADESHYLKSQKAKRTKVILPMLKKSNRAILLSGTPALSRPIELFSQLHALDSRRWSSEGEFGKRYCRPKPGESKYSYRY
jgi:SWI/SNF-related matrix-associated actin-dependent regulator 1 of chromatin subfamily A